MTTDEMHDLFEKFEDEYIKFENVIVKFSNRPDLHAFILLDKLIPNKTNDMVSAAEHDQIYLSIDPEELASVVTEHDVLTLVRCGVRFDKYNDCICMFV